MVFLDNTARRPTQSEVTSGRINPSPTNPHHVLNPTTKAKLQQVINLLKLNLPKLLPLLALPLLLTSCMGESPQFIGTPRLQGGLLHETVAEEAPEAELLEYTVFFQEPAANFALYEPRDGAYIGAWLSQETSIRVFEHQTEKRHAVYVNEMNLGDEIPITWLLQCMSAQATPLFVIHPPNNPDLEAVPALELAAGLAERLGSFNLPMFIAFYPEAELNGFMPAEYTLLFSQARNIFKAHAPMAAFTWLAPSYLSTPKNPYFPGNQNVDWVALSVLDDAENFEIFYESFYKHAPIMILPLGISHFTRGEYIYRLTQTAEEISALYKHLQTFPRLGLIVYGDAFTLARTYHADFSISIEEKLSAAYAKAVASDYFLHSLEKSGAADTRWVRFPHSGYVLQEQTFLPLEIFEAVIKTAPPRQIFTINNQNFIDTQKVNIKEIFLCEEKRVIYIARTS